MQVRHRPLEAHPPPLLDPSEVGGGTQRIRYPLQLSRRTKIVLVSIATVLVAWWGWAWGRHEASILAPISFHVHGDSMAPTLMGEHRIAICDRCRMAWNVANVAGSTKDSFVCFHCADLVSVEPGIGFPDTVTLETLSQPKDELSRGDLVAIEWDQRARLKRIAALSGDLVDLQGLHLVINGTRLEDQLLKENPAFETPPFELPRFLIDQDNARQHSRWSADSRWHRDADGNWSPRVAVDHAWLVYYHRSVHDQNLPSVVWDDHPFNIHVDRKLHPVDRLHFRAAVTCSSSARIEVAFWSDQGSVSVVKTIDQGAHEISASYVGAKDSSFDDELAGSQRDELPVSGLRPVAFRLLDGDATVSDLKIERSVEYRIRPQDDRTMYPLRVGVGECFVLGDNVPVSVDSRNVGLVPIENIIGRVTRVTPRKVLSRRK